MKKDILIQDVQVFVTAPRKINLVVVKVLTSEPGLVGYGCATFTWRHKSVVSAIRDYLAPMVKGRKVNAIEDIWQTMKGSSYWRNGPVLNNAIAGIDEALWDIKGKMAGMPIYELLGGKAREGIALYRHADAQSLEELEKQIQGYLDEGYRHIRCHMGTYGGNFNGKQRIAKPDNAPEGAYFDPKTYMASVVEMFTHLREDFGWEIEMMHDVHERLSLADTLSFAKQLEKFRLFFLEDSLSPDQAGYFEKIRYQTNLPIAMGELFTNPVEWRHLIQNQYIDYIRCHITDIGGLTPAIKLAHFCDTYAVRTAWHGPNDISPIGAAAQFHLDLNMHNFGIQEFSGFTDEEKEVFPGCPEVHNGYAYLRDVPGIGVGFDEKAAEKYPECKNDDAWLYSRLPDGTAVRP